MNSTETSTYEFRLIAAAILTIVSVVGCFFNTLACFVLCGPISKNIGFFKICCVKSLSNMIICYGFLIWPIPCTILNQYYLPEFYNVLFGQVLGWFAETLGPLTQILLASNRFLAVYYPKFFINRYNHSPTTIGLALTIFIAGVLSINGFYDGCHFIFMISIIGWAPENFPCAQQLSTFFVYFVFSLAAISNSINIVVFLKLVSNSSRLSITNLESNRRKNRRRVMFIQNVCQDILILFHMLNTNETYKIYDARWFQFACLSLSIVFTKMIEGMVMLLVNKRIRDRAMKVLRLRGGNKLKVISIGTSIV